MSTSPSGTGPVHRIVTVMRTCIWIAVAATVVATIAGWFALGSISDQVTRGADAGVSTLQAAATVSGSSRGIARELDSLAATLVDGTSDVAEVTELVVDLADQIAGLAETVSRFVSAADSAAENLRNIEERVEGVHTSLVEGSRQLEVIAEEIGRAANDLDDVPAQLTHAEHQLATVRDQASRSLWLQRAAVTVGALAVVAGLLAFERLARLAPSLVDAATSTSPPSQKTH